MSRGKGVHTIIAGAVRIIFVVNLRAVLCPDTRNTVACRVRRLHIRCSAPRHVGQATGITTSGLYGGLPHGTNSSNQLCRAFLGLVGAATTSSFIPRARISTNARTTARGVTVGSQGSLARSNLVLDGPEWGARHVRTLNTDSTARSCRGESLVEHGRAPIDGGRGASLLTSFSA